MTEQAAESYGMGDLLAITGRPGPYEWMIELVGKIGRVEAVNDDEPPVVYGLAIDGEPDLLWFGHSFLEPKPTAPDGRDTDDE